MKTQCTVETSDSVRTLVALRLTGELRLASREEVRKYFEGVLEDEVAGMEIHIDLLTKQDRIAYPDGMKEITPTPADSSETNEDGAE